MDGEQDIGVRFRPAAPRPLESADDDLLAGILCAAGSNKQSVLPTELVAPSTHKSPFDACRLRCGICDSIRRIDKPRLQFIELHNEKEAKSFKRAASSDRLAAARRRGFQITRTSH